MTTPLPSIPYADDKPVALPFKDRRIGLRVMGAILIVIGGVAGLVAIAIPFIAVTSRAYAKSSGTVHVHDVDVLEVIPTVLMCGCFALFFLFAGIASIRIRRWVRPMILIVGWPWLVCGAAALVLWMIHFLESRFDGLSSTATSRPVGYSEPAEIVNLISMVLVQLVMPGLLIWFYGKSNVSLTLGYFDFRPSWTDRVPTPVIGIAAWLVMTAAWLCFQVCNPVVSMLGTILNGPRAIAVHLLVAGVSLFLAWAVVHQRPVGWWGTMLLLVLIVASMTITHALHSTLEYMAKAGYSEAALSELSSEGGRKLSASLDNLIPLILAIGYLVYVRRLFIGVRNADVVPMAQLSGAADLTPL